MMRNRSATSILRPQGVIGLMLSLVVVSFCNVAEAQSDRGWWVVVGSVPSPDNTITAESEVAVGRIAVAARRCGLDPFEHFSSKFSNFKAGYLVVVVGAYGSKAVAEEVLAKAKECLPDAYLKQGSYAGE